MKDIRLALRAVLVTDATVSGLASTRIFPIVMPQGARDATVVYSRVTEVADYHMQGDSGLAQCRMQVDCWAQKADDAVRLANAVYDRLSGFRGTVAFGSNSPQETIEIQGVFMEQAREDYDETAELHRMSRDYIIFYAGR